MHFFHDERNISIVVHGDDFNALGVADELNWYEKELATHFEIKIRGRMGPGGDCDQIKILNRILTLTKDGLEYEADPRHADLLLSSMGLTKSNSVSTPGVKEHEADYTLVKSEESPERPSLSKIMAEDITGKVIMGDTCSKDPDCKIGAETNLQVHTCGVDSWASSGRTFPTTSSLKTLPTKSSMKIASLSELKIGSGTVTEDVDMKIADSNLQNGVNEDVDMKIASSSMENV